MAVTYDLISTYTVTAGGGDSAIDLTGITQSYDDLVCYVEGYNTGGTGYAFNYKVNSNTDASLCTIMGLQAYGNANSYEGFSPNVNNVGAKASCDLTYMSGDSNEWFNLVFYLNQYSNTSAPTSTWVDIASLTSYSGADIACGFAYCSYGTNTAVTSINLSIAGGNLAQHSVVRLYGISNTV